MCGIDALRRRQVCQSNPFIPRWGWPEIAIEVLHRLVAHAGLYLFVPHDTGEPIVVDPNMSLRDTLAAYNAGSE